MEEITFIDLLELLALATATFLGLHFITTKELSQKFLGGFLLLGFVFDLADRALLFLSYDFPIEFLPNTAFIYFPFLYFYSLQLTGQSNKKIWRLLYPATLFYFTHLLALLLEADLYFFIENQFAYLFSIYICFLVLKRYIFIRITLFNFSLQLKIKS